MKINTNDIIIGVSTAIVIIFVILIGMGVQSPTEEQLPFVEETQRDLLSAVFTNDVLTIISSLVIIAIVAIIIYIARMYQGWSFGDK